jgi:peptide/nickel transport system substrate-binding protein
MQASMARRDELACHCLLDCSTDLSQGVRGQQDVAIRGVSADNNDADGMTVVLDTLFSATRDRSSEVAAPRTIPALARGWAELDQARRVEIQEDVQCTTLETVPLIGLARRSRNCGMDRRGQNSVGLHSGLFISSGRVLQGTRLG